MPISSTTRLASEVSELIKSRRKRAFFDQAVQHFKIREGAWSVENTIRTFTIEIRNLNSTGFHMQTLVESGLTGVRTRIEGGDVVTSFEIWIQ